MFSSQLKHSSNWSNFLYHPVLLRSLEWLQKYAVTAEQGDYSLGDTDWYTNIHSYQTLPEKDCCWENHTRTIDIQYMIEGNEGIRWIDAKKLGQPRRCFEDIDRQEFSECKVPTSLLCMRPGTFVIFMPGEAHCPKITLDTAVYLRKAVVKIPVLMLNQ